MNDQTTRDPSETKPALPPRLFIRPPPRKPTVINELKMKVPLPKRLASNEFNGPTIEFSQLLAIKANNTTGAMEKNGNGIGGIPVESEIQPDRVFFSSNGSQQMRSYQPFSDNSTRTNAPNTLCLANNSVFSSLSSSSTSTSPPLTSSSAYAIVSPQNSNPGFSKSIWGSSNGAGGGGGGGLCHSNSYPHFDALKRENHFNHHNQHHRSHPFSYNSNSVQNLSYFYSTVASQVNNETVKDMLEKIRKLGEVEKLPNENLIDLGPNYHVDPHDDLLHLFDPLMVNEQPNNQEETRDACDSAAIRSDNNHHMESSEKAARALLETTKEISKSSFCPPARNLEESSKSTNHPNEFESREESAIKPSNGIPEDKCFKVRFRNTRADRELTYFATKVKQLRCKFPFNDKSVNPGFVKSTGLDCRRDNTLSVKLQIYNSSTESPITFTCNVNTTVGHVVCHAVCTILEDTSHVNFDDYVLKVNCLNEYLVNGSTLGDYAYIHHCHMFDEDVRLTLIDTKTICHRIFARTKVDDEEVINLSADELLPQLCVCKFGEINCDSVNILLETLEKEISKLVFNSSHESLVKSIKGVIQATKALCSLLGNCDTIQLTEAIENLSQLSLVYDQYKKRGEIILNKLSDEQLETIHKEVFNHAIIKLKRAVREVLELFCAAFPVDFEMIPAEEEEKKSCDPKSPSCSLSTMSEALLVYIGTVNCLSFDWKMRYREFYVVCELWFGETLIGNCKTGRLPITQGLFQRIVFNELLHFESVLLSSLPRESHLYFNLYAIEFPTTSEPSSSSEKSETPKLVALSVLKLLDFQEKLVQGSVMLGMWTGDIVNKADRTCFNTPCLDKGSPLIVVNLPEHGSEIFFPSIESESVINTYIKQDLNLLDSATQTDIHVILNSDPVQRMTRSDENIIWDRRHFLHELPSALPKVLKATSSWKWSYLNDIYSMIKTWQPLPAIDAMQLLLPSFLDKFVRESAVKWIARLDNDEIVDYLPQLIQALRFEPYFDSALIWFLLEKAYSSVRIAHNLYWLLKQNLDDPIFSYRSRIYLNALLLTCGEALRKLFENQETLLSKLSLASDHLKATKDSNRLIVLCRDLEPVDDFLMVNPLALPLSPSMQVVGLNIKYCSYFTSNTLPLKLAFKSEMSSSTLTHIDAIYKVGDDLRQDSFTMQMIKIMDKLWLKEGLDLKIVTFGCMATDFRKGFVEIVKNAETLRKIQTEYGITGSFRDSCISEWLQKYNTSELEYRKAVENFTYSLAGYVVVTYVLGIGDRHNDNIMITTSGHLFHIDFGKYLGDAQMLGTIKRDRTPFILTSDMAYVINGGDKPSKQFQYFVDLCCQAFNIIRRHTNLFLNLFSLMVSSGIPGLSIDAVKYIHRTLLPSLTEAEATAAFNKMIGETLSSVSTKFNFFLHNLAQLRFTGDHNDPTTLSFVPKTYTKETDGRIVNLRVESFYKKYEPEKVYIYVIRVEREHQKDPSYVCRSYREFYELHQKMTSLFPLVRLYPLNRSSSFMGRSNTREVAEKRKPEIDFFLMSLMQMTEEIAHSDIIYTFFHPILRDQESIWGQTQTGINNDSSSSFQPCGSNSSTTASIKLSIQYRNGELTLMVMHAKNLQSPRSSSPDCYVKTYLLPDSSKSTKRKTSIVNRNSHPTFMEMITYSIPKELALLRLLQVSVWDHDRVTGNLFIGQTLIPLNELDLTNETVDWYPLS